MAEKMERISHRAILLPLAIATAVAGVRGQWVEGLGRDLEGARKAAARAYLADILDPLRAVPDPAAAEKTIAEVLEKPEAFVKTIETDVVDTSLFGYYNSRFRFDLEAVALRRRLQGTPLCGPCCRKPVVRIGLESPGTISLNAMGGLNATVLAYPSDTVNGLSGEDFLLHVGLQAGMQDTSRFYGHGEWSAPMRIAIRLEKSRSGEYVYAKDTVIAVSSRGPGRAALAVQSRAATLIPRLIAGPLDSAWAALCFDAQAGILDIGASGQAYPDWADSLAGARGIESITPLAWGPQGGRWEFSFRGPFPELLANLKATIPARFEGFSGNRFRFRLDGSQTQAALLPAAAPGLELIRARFPPLFLGRLAAYSLRPADSLHVRNVATRASSRMRIRVRIDGIVGDLFDSTLAPFPPGGELAFPVSLAFPRASIEAEAVSRRAFAIISIGPVGARPPAREFRVPVWLHPRNVFSWSEPEAISSYVTPTDPALLAFLRQAEGRSEAGLLERLARIYEALAVHGIRYAPDPRHNAGDEGELDEIKYPAETLRGKSGDCDDLSVLYASLLEASGIETRLLLFPNHILVMAAAGIPISRAASLAADTSLVIPHSGEAWIPVEPTAIGKAGFLEAWSLAAARLNDGSDEGMATDVINPLASWSRYPATASGVKPMPAELPVDTLDARVARFMKAWREANGKAATALLGRGSGVAGAGAAIAYWGDRAGWRASLEKTRVGRNPAAGALNNLGNIRMLDGKYDSAIALYRESLGKEPGASGCAANLGLGYALAGQEDSALARLRDAALRDQAGLAWVRGLGAVNASAGLAKARPADTARIKRFADMDLRVRRILFKVVSRLPAPPSAKPDSARTFREYHPVGGDAAAAQRSVPVDEGMLWWF